MTLPFTSTRVLEQSHNEAFQHGVIGNLDSITWVLLYEIPDSSDEKALTAAEKRSLRTLRSTRLDNLSAGKHQTRSFFQPNRVERSWSKPVRSFSTLFMPLLDLGFAAEVDLGNYFRLMQGLNHEGANKVYWEGLNNVCDKYFNTYRMQS